MNKGGCCMFCDIFGIGEKLKRFVEKCGGQIERRLRLHRKRCYHERFIENVATNGA